MTPTTLRTWKRDALEALHDVNALTGEECRTELKRNAKRVTELVSLLMTVIMVDKERGTTE